MDWEEWERERRFEEWLDENSSGGLLEDFMMVYCVIAIGCIGGVLLGMGILIYQAITG